VYRALTDKIVTAIEAGAGEFRLPWHRSRTSIGRPMNAVTTMPYHGVNVVALWAEAGARNFDSGFWATYRQWQSEGAQVRKGETGSLIVFFRRTDPDENDAEASRRRIIARTSFVFNAEQVDDWVEPDTHRFPTSPAEILETVENYVRATGATVRHKGQSAYYDRRSDEIVLPERRLFLGTETSTPTEAYYATLLHELTHWTGSKQRLDREFGARFGDQAYAFEELVADLGAAFLCADLEITNEPRADHAAYLSQWLSILKGDSRAIFTAAKAANTASDFLNQIVVLPHKAPEDGAG
jgi:antirestriction protein ArdC